MSELLRFENVTYSYQDGSNKVTILDQCNYTFEKGKIYAIVGASGSGKTTTVVLAGGLDKPKSGKVYFDGKDIQKKGLEKYRRDDISIVFQSYNLIHYMNALENVLNGMRISKMKVNNPKEYALKILNQLGLSKEQSLRDIRKLSGGQQQRIAIARAMAKDVDLILADEPTGNLDEKNSKDILNTFVNLAHEQNKCVIIVTHSNSLANKCDVQLKIQNGKIVEV